MRKLALLLLICGSVQLLLAADSEPSTDTEVGPPASPNDGSQGAQQPPQSEGSQGLRATDPKEEDADLTEAESTKSDSPEGPQAASPGAAKVSQPEPPEDSASEMDLKVSKEPGTESDPSPSKDTSPPEAQEASPQGSLEAGQPLTAHTQTTTTQTEANPKQTETTPKQIEGNESDEEGEDEPEQLVTVDLKQLDPNLFSMYSVKDSEKSYLLVPKAGNEVRRLSLGAVKLWEGDDDNKLKRFQIVNKVDSIVFVVITILSRGLIEVINLSCDHTLVSPTAPIHPDAVNRLGAFGLLKALRPGILWTLSGDLMINVDGMIAIFRKVTLDTDDDFDSLYYQHLLKEENGNKYESWEARELELISEVISGDKEVVNNDAKLTKGGADENKDVGIKRVELFTKADGEKIVRMTTVSDKLIFKEWNRAEQVWKESNEQTFNTDYRDKGFKAILDSITTTTSSGGTDEDGETRFTGDKLDISKRSKRFTYASTNLYTFRLVEMTPRGEIDVEHLYFGSSPIANLDATLVSIELAKGRDGRHYLEVILKYEDEIYSRLFSRPGAKSALNLQNLATFYWHIVEGLKKSNMLNKNVHILEASIVEDKELSPGKQVPDLPEELKHKMDPKSGVRSAPRQVVDTSEDPWAFTDPQVLAKLLDPPSPPAPASAASPQVTATTTTTTTTASTIAPSTITASNRAGANRATTTTSSSTTTSATTSTTTSTTTGSSGPNTSNSTSGGTTTRTTTSGSGEDVPTQEGDGPAQTIVPGPNLGQQEPATTTNTTTTTSSSTSGTSGTSEGTTDSSPITSRNSATIGSTIPEEANLRGDQPSPPTDSTTTTTLKVSTQGHTSTTTTNSTTTISTTSTTSSTSSRGTSEGTTSSSPINTSPTTRRSSARSNSATTGSTGVVPTEAHVPTGQAGNAGGDGHVEAPVGPQNTRETRDTRDVSVDQEAAHLTTNSSTTTTASTTTSSSRAAVGSRDGVGPTEGTTTASTESSTGPDDPKNSTSTTTISGTTTSPTTTRSSASSSSEAGGSSPSASTTIPTSKGAATATTAPSSSTTTNTITTTSTTTTASTITGSNRAGVGSSTNTSTTTSSSGPNTATTTDATGEEVPPTNRYSQLVEVGTTTDSSPITTSPTTTRSSAESNSATIVTSTASGPLPSSPTGRLGSLPFLSKITSLTRSVFTPNRVGATTTTSSSSEGLEGNKGALRRSGWVVCGPLGPLLTAASLAVLVAS